MNLLTMRTARLVIGALVVALLGLGVIGALPPQSALAVCQPCHVPTPPQDNQDFDPIDWSLYDGIERDDPSDADHADACMDHEQQMCVADEDTSNAEDNMCSEADLYYEDDYEDDLMTSAEDYMCVAP